MKGKDPTQEELKKLERLSKSIIKANKEILAMGYDVYLSAHGRANVMKGPSHNDNDGCSQMQENVVFSFPMEKWDGGDW